VYFVTLRTLGGSIYTLVPAVAIVFLRQVIWPLLGVDLEVFASPYLLFSSSPEGAGVGIV